MVWLMSVDMTEEANESSRRVKLTVDGSPAEKCLSCDCGCQPTQQQHLGRDKRDVRAERPKTSSDGKQAEWRKKGAGNADGPRTMQRAKAVDNGVDRRAAPRELRSDGVRVAAVESGVVW